MGQIQAVGTQSDQSCKGENDLPCRLWDDLLKSNSGWSNQVPSRQKLNEDRVGRNVATDASRSLLTLTLEHF